MVVNKIVLNVQEGSTIRTQSQQNGVLTVDILDDKNKSIAAIEELKEAARANRRREENYRLEIPNLIFPPEELSYQHPYIPDGFAFKENICKETWNNGFWIMKDNSPNNIFVWVPAGSIEPDGTLDGKTFDQRFGRRNFCGEKFSENEFYEEDDEKLIWSVNKNGGFWISSDIAYMRHDASRERSKQLENFYLKGECQGEKEFYFNRSVVFQGINEGKNEEMINYARYAPKLATAKKGFEEYIGERRDIDICIPNGAVYDTLYKWLMRGISSNPKCKNENSATEEGYSIYNISGLAGKYSEVSTERYGKNKIVDRNVYLGCYTNWPRLGRKPVYYNTTGRLEGPDARGYRAVIYKL